MSILSCPSSVDTFFRIFVDGSLVPLHILLALPSFVSAIVLAGGRKTFRKLAWFVFEARRSPGTVSRMFGCRMFRSRDLLREAVRRAVEEVGATIEEAQEWLVGLDGTCLSRGAGTKIKGANQYRVSQRAQRKKRRKKGRGRKKLGASRRVKRKGRETKSHMFLMAVLVAPDGTRIPLPRYTCDPKDFKRQGRPPKKQVTQLDLAKLMLDDVLSMLPDSAKLIVCADSYFESKKLTEHSRRRGYAFIAPAATNRCFGEDKAPYRSNGHKLYEYGYALCAAVFDRIVLFRGSEGTASFRRYTARKPGRKDHRTFEVYREERIVAGLGEVAVVFSKKSPVHSPKKDFRKKNFRVLVCSDLSLSAAEIAEYYDTRWTVIEVFFREAKGRLGLGDYTGQSLEALERYIDVVLLSFLFLEMQRRELLNEGGIEEDIKRLASFARTTGMQELIRFEVSEEFLALVERSSKSERAMRLLKRFLRKRPTVPDAETCRAYGA